jgi:hypothetical protein
MHSPRIGHELVRGEEDGSIDDVPVKDLMYIGAID